MARPRTVSDDDILASTRRACMEFGARTSIDFIAEKLGISAPAILKRFGSKDRLLIKALSPPAEPAWVHQVANGPDSRPLVQQLEEMFYLISSFFAEIIPCLSALRESGVDVHNVEAMQKAPLLGIEAIRVWLDEAQAAGLVHCEDADTAATAMLGSVQFHGFLSHIVRRTWSESAQRKYNRSLAELYAAAFAPAPRPKKSPEKKLTPPGKTASRRKKGQL